MNDRTANAGAALLLVTPLWFIGFASFGKWTAAVVSVMVLGTVGVILISVGDP